MLIISYLLTNDAEGLTLLTDMCLTGSVFGKWFGQVDTFDVTVLIHARVVKFVFSM